VLRSCLPSKLAFSIAAALAVAPAPVPACDLALVLAVDISGSVDPDEYRIQMDGLAAALRDPTVSEALVRAEAAVTLVQWTGRTRQTVSVPWTRIAGFRDAEALAQAVETAPRAWRNFSTAIGEAMAFAVERFETGPDCRRRILDISGDGRSNEGIAPRRMHPALAAAGIVVNALAIEESEDDLTGYFWENVIRGPGAFVVTANDFAAYPARIRQKLLREITLQMSAADPGSDGRR